MLVDTDDISGLSWSVDEKSLKDAFSSFGDVVEGDDNIMNMNIFPGVCLFAHFHKILQCFYVFDFMSHSSVLKKFEAISKKILLVEPL